MEVSLLKGRSFSDRDSSSAPLVVVINEALAREAWRDRDPIGQQIGIYGLNGISWRTVVGMVADTRNGLGIGLVGALGLTRFLSSFLYGIRPTDLTTFVTAVLVLTGAALLACYIPARRGWTPL